MPHPISRTGPDRGAVTAETAAALPILILVLWLVLAVLRLGEAQLSCQDAARAAARAAARGEPLSVVVETAQTSAPDGAVVSVTAESGLLAVEVQAPIRWAGPLRLPTFTVTGRAVAAPEERAP